VAIGTDGTRNSIFFPRPSAGVWHHYVIAIDTNAAASSEITPYVDGEQVTGQQESSNIGQGNFANSTLYLLSRDGNSLFGGGALSQLAIYNQALAASTAFNHFHSNDVNVWLTPSFTTSPSAPATGQNVTLDASGSTDTLGTITDYKWDLDGSGSYTTDTGATPTLVHAFSTPGTVTVGLQTTDSNGIVARTTHSLTITQAPPSTPVLTLSNATGSTFIAGSTAYTRPLAGSSGGFTLNASTSDPFSGIKNVVLPALSGFASGGGTFTATPYQSTYAWSGAAATASGSQTVTATNNAGVSASSTFAVVPDTAAPTGGALTVNGIAATATGSTAYNLTGTYPIGLRTDFTETQSATQSGLRSSTLTIAQAPLAANACGTFGATTTIAGSPAQSEANGCYRYTLTGIDNVGNTASLSTTVIVDTTRPTTPALVFSAFSANTFYKSSTNALYFSPSPGGSFTLTASSTDPETGIAGYTFSSLAGNGFLIAQTGGQAIYTFGATATQPAAAPTLLATSNAGATSANATYSLIADTTGPTGGALSVNNTAATAAGSTSYSTSGSFTIGTRTDFNADAGAGFSTSVLTRASGTLSEGACTKLGTPTTLAGNPTQLNLAVGCYVYTLTGTDRVGNKSLLSTTVEVDKTAPVATLSVPAHANGPVAVTFAATDAGSGINPTSGQLRRASSTYTPSSDSCGTLFLFSNIGATGLSSPFNDTSVTTGKCYEYEYTVADHAGNQTTSPGATVKVNTTKPTLTSITDTTPGTTAGLPQVGNAITLNFSDLIDATTIPSSVKLTYTRTGTSSSTVLLSGIGATTAWSTGDPTTARYTKTGGTSAVVTASTAVSGTTVKLTITSISDPSGNLTVGGPGAVSGALSASVKDVFGNVASTSTFTTASIRLF
jgi:PKD domain